MPGEDPYLNGMYGIYFTLGLQNGSTTYNSKYYDARYYQAIATLKHYAAYSLENYEGIDRHDFNAIVSKYMLNDTYLPPWEMSIKTGGAKGVMCSYNAGMFFCICVCLCFLYFFRLAPIFFANFLIVLLLVFGAIVQYV